MHAWREDLVTGNETMDAQHRALFDLARQAVEATEDSHLAQVVESLTRFEELLLDHYQVEEALMESAPAGHRATHTEAHAAFHGEVARELARLPSKGITPAFRLWIDSRFAPWFRHHIRASDFALVSATRGAQAAAGR